MFDLPDLTPWRDRVARLRRRWLIRVGLLLSVSLGGALFSAWMALDVLIRLEPDHRAERARVELAVEQASAELAVLTEQIALRQVILRDHARARAEATTFLAPIESSLRHFPPGLGLLRIERQTVRTRWQVQLAHATALSRFERAVSEAGWTTSTSQVSRDGPLITVTLEADDA